MSASGSGSGSDSVSSVSISSSEEGEVEYTLEMPDVVTKYKTAGEICNKVLQEVASVARGGGADCTVLSLCDLGDSMIADECAKVYAKDKTPKGVAWPTSISINHVMGHNSPLATDDSANQAVVEGDVVKIDLGVHIDGCIAVAATTVICGTSGENGGEGPAADVVAAATTAGEVVKRLVKKDNPNTKVTEAFAAVAEAYGVNVMEGVLSHEVARFIIDGDDVCVSKDTPEVNIPNSTFEAGKVYVMDVVMTTGEGKGKPCDARTTIYRRDVEAKYKLKMKAAREVFSEINQRFPSLPFTVRSLNNPTRGRYGLTELVEHDLVVEYPVLAEHAGALVAHYKYTILIMPNGNVSVIAGVEPPPVNSTVVFDHPDFAPLLSQGLGKKKKNKGKKKKASKPAEPAA